MVYGLMHFVEEPEPENVFMFAVILIKSGWPSYKQHLQIAHWDFAKNFQRRKYLFRVQSKTDSCGV